MKPKLNISFSGGRTSAVMTKLLLDEKRETHDIRVTFANTGCEHPDTLRFVNDCDKEWGFNVAWLEAIVTHGERVGIRHKIVTYETASRNGEPYEEAVKKYGVFNVSYPNCTGRLKAEVMESYLKTQGFFRGKRLNYDTAIGIRADEIDRVSAKRKENRFIYPLVGLGFTKKMVIEFMKQFDFDLKIPEHMGNCVWCFKKSFRKLYTIATESPESFDFPLRIEKEYQDRPRPIFRKNTTTEQLLEDAANKEFDPFVDSNFDYENYDPDLDGNSGCSESCEVYPTNGE